MIYLILAIALFVAAFVWLKTGRSPFWWAAMFFILLEAIRLQLIEDFAPACRLFVQHVRARFAVVRQEIGGTV